MKEIKKRMTFENIIGLLFAYCANAFLVYVLSYMGLITGKHIEIFMANSLFFIMATLMMIEIELRHERNDKV